MNWRISIVGFILLLSFGCKKNDSTSELKQVSKNYLIELEELESIIRNPNIKLIDFRKPALYSENHISGSINIWRTDIEELYINSCVGGNLAGFLTGFRDVSFNRFCSLAARNSAL